MKARPHPGPLPQERENRRPSVCEGEVHGEEASSKNPVGGGANQYWLFIEWKFCQLLRA